MMDNRFIFRTIFLVMMATASEAIFFDYPKKALMDFLHSLKEKKEAAVKKSHDDVHHYHLHYYPVPVSLVFDEQVKLVSGKRELDHLHREELKSLGWTNQEYKHVPEPKIIIPSVHDHHESVSDPWAPHHQSHSESDVLSLQDQLDIAAIKHELELHHSQHPKHHIVEPRHQTHISLHLPFHQEIVLHQPVAAPQIEEKKVHPLMEFFQKLQHIKNSLFSSQDEKKSSSHHCENKMEKSSTSVTSKIRSANAFAIYFHPKNIRKF